MLCTNIELAIHFLTSFPALSVFGLDERGRDGSVRPFDQLALQRLGNLLLGNRSGHQLNYILLTFYNQGSVWKSVFSTIKVCVSCCWRCPGTSTRLAQQTEGNAQGKSRALVGHPGSSKSPSRVQDGDKGVLFPNEGSLIFPSLQTNDFLPIWPS